MARGVQTVFGLDGAIGRLAITEDAEDFQKIIVIILRQRMFGEGLRRPADTCNPFFDIFVPIGQLKLAFGDSLGENIGGLFGIRIVSDGFLHDKSETGHGGTVDDALLPFVPNDFVDILPSVWKILPKPFFADSRSKRKDEFGSLYARGICFTDFSGDEEPFIPRNGIFVEFRAAVVRNIAEQGAVVASFGETVWKCTEETAEKGEFWIVVSVGVFAPMEALRIADKIIRRS